jgi:hypothetical protein
MKKSLFILATSFYLILVFSAWGFASNPSSADSNPPATVAPPTPPAAQNPTMEEVMAKSLAFRVTVVSVGDQSITVLIDGAPTTLPIDESTSLVALSSIKDIKPHSTIGIRLTEDKKRVLVLNGKG